MSISAETRVKILDAAGAVFFEKGYGNATVSDIVSLADVAKGTFYIYFKSKKDCLNALSLELMLSLMKDISAEKEHYDKDSIHRIISMLFESIDKHSQILRILHFEQGNMESQVIETHNRIHDTYLDVVMGAFMHMGLSEKTARIKTELIDAVMKQYLLDEILIFNPAFRKQHVNVCEMLKTIIDDIKLDG